MKLKNLLLKEVIVRESESYCEIELNFHFLNSSKVIYPNKMDAYHELIGYKESKVKFKTVEGGLGNLESAVMSYFRLLKGNSF